MKTKKISLFYKILLGVLLVLLLGFAGLRFLVLRPWLVRFEAAQPKHVSREVFADLFDPADWDRVCQLAGVEEDRDRAVRLLEERTEGRELTLVETSAGLSGGRRYIVKAGEEGVAAFTLAPGGEGTPWQLDQVELLAELEPEWVLVRTLAGQRVLESGEELGEDCKVQTTETAAERYLPEGVHGRRTVLWEAPGDQLSVLKEDGGQVPLVWEGENGCYAVLETEGEPSEEEQKLCLNAARTYARYMIRQATSAQLQKYFDSGSAIYRTIRSSEIWISQTAGHTFSNEGVRDFCRYGEDVFSARVSLHMDVKRGNGTSKPYEVDTTLFFHRAEQGWRAFEMTNVDVREELTRTRLVFLDGETELGRLFVSSEDRSFTPPTPVAQEGRQFAGWAVREQEGNRVTMTVRFQPDGDGNVTLPPGYELEPMTLYAVFE